MRTAQCVLHPVQYTMLDNVADHWHLIISAQFHLAKSIWNCESMMHPSKISTPRATSTHHKIQWCMSTKSTFQTATSIYNEVCAVAWSKMRKVLGMEAWILKLSIKTYFELKKHCVLKIIESEEFQNKIRKKFWWKNE